MAVSLTVAQLANALRVGDTTEETELVARLLSASTELVQRYAPDAPDAVLDEAVVRLSGYLFDMPNAPGGARYTNALRNSGAAGLLSLWRVIGATPLLDPAPTGGGLDEARAGDCVELADAGA